MSNTFPFAAIVGQEDMKLAIIMSAIDPKIGGVLVFGDRGTGKSTAVRGLANLLPPINSVDGCPVNSSSLDETPTWSENTSKKIVKIPMPVVDLPLGIGADRVTGALDIEKALVEGVKSFQPGLLAKANRGYLYIDEVNLLEDHIVDLLLDVSQSGENVIEREGLSIRHASNFILIGSGNPEEGELRPQLLDRFGLSVEVLTPQTIKERIEVIKRRDLFDQGPEEFQNNSKSILAYTLNKKNNEILDNDNLNEKDLLIDIFSLNDLETDTVRLNASTIKQLFEDTDYKLDDVREKKLVKPVALTLLPAEIKMIENTKRRKEFFIQIVLPLILKENNNIRLDRKMLFTIINKNNNSKLEKKWLEKKYKQYGIPSKDLSTLKVRMDEIPVSLAIAQAAKETGWGTSRFAQEGNALFGQWTWSGEGLKPKEADGNEGHKVMKFNVLQASVRAYQRNLNTHSSYKNFRLARAQLRDTGKPLDSILLSQFLEHYAETGNEYVEVLKKIIKQNNLKDFDDAKLLPSSIELESLI